MKLELIINLLLFVGTLCSAWYFDWQARDLVWGLWLSSLVVGHLTLFTGLLETVSFGKNPDWKPSGTKTSLKDLVIVLLIIGSIATFCLGFFIVHFGFFHFIHGSFLDYFFPLPNVTYPKSPWVLPRHIWILLHFYWPFVLASTISELSRTFSKINNKTEPAPKTSGPNTSGKDNFDNAFMRPYKSVIRMHFMIFIFAALKGLHATNFIFYAITLSVYFFPWRLLKLSAKEKIAGPDPLNPPANNLTG